MTIDVKWPEEKWIEWIDQLAEKERLYMN